MLNWHHRWCVQRKIIGLVETDFGALAAGPAMTTDNKADRGDSCGTAAEMITAELSIEENDKEFPFIIVSTNETVPY